jgi:hypothetical protein
MLYACAPFMILNSFIINLNSFIIIVNDVLSRNHHHDGARVLTLFECDCPIMGTGNLLRIDGHVDKSTFNDRINDNHVNRTVDQHISSDVISSTS